MFVLIIFGLSVSLLVLFGMFVLAFLEVAFDRQGSVPSESATWQPPTANGDRLLAWAASNARWSTEKQLTRSRGRCAVHSLMASVYRGLECALNFSRNSFSQREPRCPSCRNRRIGVTVPELLVIAESVCRTKSAKQIRSIRERAEQNLQGIGQPDGQASTRTVCPLFGGCGTCEVFNARPIHCRSWCPTSDSQSDRSEFIECDGVLLDSYRRTVGRGVQKGVSDGVEAVGLDSRVYELNSGLLAALDNPSAADQWLHGDSVFASCRQYV